VGVSFRDAKIGIHTMQHARATLKKIYAEAVCRDAGDEAPLLAWPVVCGTTVAEKTRALSFVDGVLVVAVPDKVWRTQLQQMYQQYLAGLQHVSGRPVRNISFVVAPHATRSGV
jgi:predicted nucleic acid-binding Zn ribbon protein